MAAEYCYFMLEFGFGVFQIFMVYRKSIDNLNFYFSLVFNLTVNLANSNGSKLLRLDFIVISLDEYR